MSSPSSIATVYCTLAHSSKTGGSRILTQNVGAIVHVQQVPQDFFILVWFPKILSAQIRLMMKNQRIIRRDAFDPSSAGNIGR